MTAERDIDCVVAGSCVVDLLVRGVSLDSPIGHGVLHETGPQLITGGGITSNSGVTMARLGMKIAIFSLVGNDAWAPVIRHLYQAEGIDDTPLLTHETGSTSTTVVMIDPTGERSFYHCVGAPKLLKASDFLDQMPLWRRSRMLLLGYYSLMPNLEPDLPQVLEKVRAAGCRTALDAAGDGGAMEPLDRILPYLDVYVPSLGEATHQTGETDPRTIIKRYRSCGAPGLLGVKLGGTRGVMLSPKPDDYLHVESCEAPGEVVDTTGAGDSFYAGLLTGLLKDLPLEQAGKLGTAAGACCVTSVGGSTGGRSYDETARIAGLA